MNNPQSGDQEAQLIRPEHDDRSVQVSPDAEGFKTDTRASVPAFEIPDVALDAIGLPADVMAQQVPTLGEAVSPGDAGSPTALHQDAPSDAPPAAGAPATPAGQGETSTAQAPAGAADTWVVQMQMRIDRLAEEVRTLNDRLDRFVNHTKV